MLIKAEVKPESAKDISNVIKNLLRAAGVGDRLPTPQDDILQCAELVLRGNIDLDDYKQKFFAKFTSALVSGLSKILGFLDVREKTIIISPDVSDARKPFVTYHEVSHNILPWQVETYKYFADNNDTLDPGIEKIFEQEANYGSAQLLFQCDRFQKEARDFELSLRTGIKLKQDYGTSFHSTFWNYVETHSKSCALLVLRQCNYAELVNGGMDRPYELLYPIVSGRFAEEFAGMAFRDKYYSDHPFIQLVNCPDCSMVDIYEGEILLKNKNREKVEATFEAWSNSYNLFVLIKKKSILRFRKKRVVLANSF